MQRPIAIFAIATLLPVPLLLVGAGAGGLWAWMALLYMTGLTFALDELAAPRLPSPPPGQALAAADSLSTILAGTHFILLLTAVFALAGHTGLPWSARLPLFLAFGLYFGQVSNSNAHELIHRSDSLLFNLGRWVYISLLFGHHTSAHRLVHHRFVATEDDPNTAQAGESFYAFLPRAWLGAFVAGWEMERDMRRRNEAAGPHPYAVYLGGAVLFLLAIYILTGWGGILAYLLLCVYAQMQLTLSDYVQHYGLMRGEMADGRLEPVSDRHSWNAGHWFSSALMLNAPRHSAHHAHPAWPYPDLTLPGADQAPRLPYSLPVMATLALWPRRWFAVMDRRLAPWLPQEP